MTTPDGPAAVRNRRLIPLDDVAAELSISRRTVQRLIAAGDLNTVVIGARRFCTPAELDRYVAALRAS